MLDFDFALAIEHLRQGDKVKRDDWGDAVLYVHQQNPDANSKMTLPYFYRATPDRNLVPWTPTDNDILARDWKVVS